MKDDLCFRRLAAGAAVLLMTTGRACGAANASVSVASNASGARPSTAPWSELASSLGAGILHEIADVDTVFAECSKSITETGGFALPKVANGSCIFAGICVYEDCGVTPITANNIPSHSVEAKTVAHVQAAVDFAREHGIPVSVKGTGASYSVADQLNDNMLIWMSNYPRKSTEGVKDHTDSCGTDHGPTITASGGETFGDVFSVLAEGGEFLLSSGAAVTVGASGGWLQGGGLGPFDRSLGLGIDNVVQFEIVTADGKFRSVDACSDPDLFWALRGGGGGNFGVVISQTSKVHPKMPLTRANVMFMGAEVVQSQIPSSAPEGLEVCELPESLQQGSIGTRQPLCWTNNKNASTMLPVWWDTMLSVLNPVTMDHRLDGYYGVGCGWNGGYMCADLYFRGTFEEFETTFGERIREAMGIDNFTVATTDGRKGGYGSGSAFALIASEYPDGYYSYASQGCASPAENSPQAAICESYPSANGWDHDVQIGQGGYETRLSWMLPASVYDEAAKTEEGKARAKEFFATPLMGGATGHVLGGAVNDVKGNETATSPSMRHTAQELLFPLEWIQKTGGITNATAVLKKYSPAPNAVPIFNHDARNLDLLIPLGEPHGLDWQDLYWGSNLPRLRTVKEKYDPSKVFQCRDCLTAEL